MGYDTAVLIGSGGMGEVFKAWDPKLERYVALKYLRHDDPEMVERMFREARAQARVDHPGVCKVYEVGEDEGRPFIAMEYVEGELLDEAVKKLTIEQKVLLIQQVAEAVAAAHSVGLIHRDLKPGNIKVGETDAGAMRPYVLDFGIARQQEVAGLTVTGQVLGTPGYLSPEQACGEVTTLDRRTDVFSLGVILYEILGGRAPFEGASDAEVLVSLLGRDPTPLRKIAPDVPRDLETVVMRCLEKDLHRRYQSARELAADLGRFLAGEPVHARPISVMGRFVRKARRNKFTAALAAVSAIVIVGLLAVVVGGWIKYTADLKAERNEAVAARQEAELRAGEAREIADFVGEIFEVANPAQGGSVTARELLEQKALAVARELGDRPIERARLLNVIAESFQKLGLYDQAEQYAIRGYHLRVEALGEDHLAVAESLVTLAGIKMAGYSYEEAVAYGRQALEIRRRHLEDDDPLLASTAAGVSVALSSLGQLEEADALSREALEVLQRVRGPNHPQTVKAMGMRAQVLRRLERYDEAEQIYLEALDRQHSLYGPVAEENARTLNNLAYLLKIRGDLEGAERRYKEAMAIQDQILVRAHPQSIVVRQNLAGALAGQGKYAEAEHYLWEVLELRRELLPEGHGQIAGTIATGVGRILLDRKKYVEVEPLLREAVAICEHNPRVADAYTEIVRGSLAACLFGLGRVDEARIEVGRSLALLENVDEFSRVESYNIPWVATQLEAAGQPELAQRYSALLE